MLTRGISIREIANFMSTSRDQLLLNELRSYDARSLSLFYSEYYPGVANYVKKNLGTD